MSREYVLQETDFLVSQTDAQGNILFANEDFCKVAGYSLSELIGKPHSIVRHPDMPKAAFKDLWNTLKQGKTWTGYVKNRTKDGGYYWVFAMVYPMGNGSRSESGYISCRRKPSAEEIQSSMELYKTLDRGYYA
ncbi:PAS domain-containing protein [Sulfuricurvum sp.]|uniref:PAS domain-containing protein n=1 Tax=Sulfuricurvum sp. TaxID=2025608 RepID=UPI002E377DA1|nr:PAS domain-containing protein [Sulfuricurvum sp.]HEX5330035.1 PAS domain-containing protein [Sulfuricurvum sp.]